MTMDLKKRRIVEHQKAECREKIGFHTRNVVLQGFVSFFFISAGLFYAEKKSIMVPLVIAPSAACSLSKLATHETKRKYYKKTLHTFEKN